MEQLFKFEEKIIIKTDSLTFKKNKSTENGTKEIALKKVEMKRHQSNK